MANIEHIENSESGLSSRVKINAVIDRSNALVNITSGRTLFLDPDADEVDGKQYKTYSNCITYINSAGGSSKTNRWSVIVHTGTKVTGTIALVPWVYLSSGTVEASVEAVTTSGSDTDKESYQCFRLLIDNVDVVNASSFLTVTSCTVRDQRATTGAGTLILSDTKIFSGNGSLGAHFTSLSELHVRSNSVVALGNFSIMYMWGDSEVNIIGGPVTGVKIGSYGGSALLRLGGSLSVSDIWYFGGSILGMYVDPSGTGHYGDLHITGSGASWAENVIVNAVLYYGKIYVDGASATLSVIECTTSTDQDYITEIIATGGGDVDVISMTTPRPDRGMVVNYDTNKGGIGLPQLTTTEINALSNPRDGIIVSNITTGELWARLGGVWVRIVTAAI